MTSQESATHRFIGALNELIRVSFPNRQAAWAAVDGRIEVSRATFYDILSVGRKRCPDWSRFCRPIILACFEAALRPETAAHELELELGNERDWREFHALTEAGAWAELPLQSPKPVPPRAPSEEDRKRKAAKEEARTTVLRGAGLLQTLGDLYSEYRLTELWNQRFPITHIPAPSSEWENLESALGRPLVGSRLPAREEYSNLWYPPGLSTLQAMNKRYDELDEEGRRYFFSGSTYAFHQLRIEHGGVRLYSDLGRYFASHVTSEQLDAEMMSALAADPDRPVSLTALEQRSWLHDQVTDPVIDGRHRAAALSHATTVFLRNRRGGYDLLLPFRSDYVAAHAHFNHVAPSGILSPHSEDTYPPEMEFSVERNFFREWVEELYSADEHERPPFVAAPDPETEAEALRLKAALDGPTPTARLRYTGVSINLLTLRPEICLLLLIEDTDWWAREERIATESGRPLKFGWEYSDKPAAIRHRSAAQPDHWRVSLDENLEPPTGATFTSDFLVPNAAASIALAIPVARTLAS